MTQRQVKLVENYIRKMVRKTLNEESRKFISPGQVRSGETYQAIELDDPNSVPESVTILSVKRDAPDEYGTGASNYTIKVKLSDGSTDSWYLDKSDKVFFK